VGREGVYRCRNRLAPRGSGAPSGRSRSGWLVPVVPLVPRFTTGYFRAPLRGAENLGRCFRWFRSFLASPTGYVRAPLRGKEIENGEFLDARRAMGRWFRPARREWRRGYGQRCLGEIQRYRYRYRFRYRFTFVDGPRACGKSGRAVGAQQIGSGVTQAVGKEKVAIAIAIENRAMGLCHEKLHVYQKDDHDRICAMLTKLGGRDTKSVRVRLRLPYTVSIAIPIAIPIAKKSQQCGSCDGLSPAHVLGGIGPRRWR